MMLIEGGCRIHDAEAFVWLQLSGIAFRYRMMFLVN